MTGDAADAALTVRHQANHNNAKDVASGLCPVLVRETESVQMNVYDPNLCVKDTATTLTASP